MQFDDKAAKAHRPGPFLAPLRHRRANGDNVETRQSGNLLDRSLLLARFQVVPVKLVASFVAAQPLAQPHATAGAVASSALRRPPRSPVKDSGEGSRAGPARHQPARSGCTPR